MEVNKMLVIVDMQNDFITGPLGTPEAQAIVPKMVDYIKKFDGCILYTLDTHDSDYLNTQEGKKLPVPHCIKESDGHALDPNIYYTIMGSNVSIYSEFIKDTFGSTDLGKVISMLYKYHHYKEVYLCGVCTDICVVSNALLIKAFCPELEIKVLEDLCAGTTPERHENALNVMRSCQIDVIRGSDDE